MTDRTNYIIHTEVVGVDERKEKQYLSGVGDTARFEDISKGWFVWFKGSYEVIHVGKDKPDLKPGDKVKITIEKVTT